jgi:predicted outer membrane protein
MIPKEERMSMGYVLRGLALTLLSGAVACAGLVASADRPVQVDTVDPDAEAVAIALAANGASLHLARLALHRASHPLVRELACERIREHESAVEWLSIAAYQAEIPRAQSPDVDRLDAELAEMLADLYTRWGMGFDRAWIQASARLGDWFTVRLDSTALAAVREPTLRFGLEEIRAIIGARGQELERLQEYLVGFHN